MKKSCAIPNCQTPWYSREWCRRHYDCWRNHGDPAQKQPTTEERFNAQYSKHFNGCWIWHGTKVTRGYGQISSNGKIWRAHRLSWALHKGNIPAGVLVLHKCDNPSCVNPEHLFLGSVQDNVDDRIKKGRSARGSNMGSSKLTEANVHAIRARLSHAETHVSIAASFDVTESAISHIAAGHSWGWL